MLGLIRYISFRHTFNCRNSLLLLHHAKCMLDTHVLYWCRLEYFIPHPLQELQGIRKIEIFPHRLYFILHSVPTHNTFAPYLSLHFLHGNIWILHSASTRKVSLDLLVSIYVHYATDNIWLACWTKPIAVCRTTLCCCTNYNWRKQHPNVRVCTCSSDHDSNTRQWVGRKRLLLLFFIMVWYKIIVVWITRNNIWKWIDYTQRDTSGVQGFLIMFCVWVGRGGGDLGKSTISATYYITREFLISMK